MFDFMYVMGLYSTMLFLILFFLMLLFFLVALRWIFRVNLAITTLQSIDRKLSELHNVTILLNEMDTKSRGVRDKNRTVHN